jgi:hypothetical protein
MTVSPSVLPPTPGYRTASSDSGLGVPCLKRGRVCLESSVLFLRPRMPTPRRRRKQLPDSLKKTRRCWKLKQEKTLDRILRRTRFGRGRGLVVRLSTCSSSSLGPVSMCPGCTSAVGLLCSPKHFI